MDDDDGSIISFNTWHQQSPMIIGMADSVRAGCTSANIGSGDCYDAWLATPLNQPLRFPHSYRRQAIPVR